MAKCAVDGCNMTDLHKHHIDPVVYDPHGNGRKRKNLKIDPCFNIDKRLGDCTFNEIFSYMFSLGCVSEKETLTLCTYHHNIMHGILKFQKAQHTTLIKEGIKRAREKGIHIGRPFSVTKETRDNICELYKKGVSVKKIAKQLRCGVGTTIDTLTNVGLYTQQKQSFEKNEIIRDSING